MQEVFKEHDRHMLFARTEAIHIRLIINILQVISSPFCLITINVTNKCRGNETYSFAYWAGLLGIYGAK